MKDKIPKDTYGVIVTNRLGQIVNQDLSLFLGHMETRPLIFESMDAIRSYALAVHQLEKDFFVYVHNHDGKCIKTIDFDEEIDH